jgi:hypothetical protein
MMERGSGILEDPRLLPRVQGVTVVECLVTVSAQIILQKLRILV